MTVLRKSGHKNGFVSFKYDLASRNLLFRWVNTFVKRAIGFQCGNVFVGVLIAHENPPRIIDVSEKGASGDEG